MSTFLQDLRYALRSLFRQPSFALTAIMTLALGIGATTAIFTVVNAVLFRPLPVERAGPAGGGHELMTPTGTASADRLGAQDFDDWKAQSRSFQVIAYYAGRRDQRHAHDSAPTTRSVYPHHARLLRRAGRARRGGRLLSRGRATARWPARGDRSATPSGSSSSTATRMRSAPRVKISDSTFTIVGVLAPGLRFPARADLYVPAWISR